MPMRDAFHLDDRSRRPLRRHVAGELAERSLLDTGARHDLALDHDLGAGGHVQIDGLAAHELDRLAADAAGDLGFADIGRHRRTRDHARYRLGADGDGDRHALAARLVFLIEGRRGVLRRRDPPTQPIGAMHDVAIHAPVHQAGVGILGDVDVPCPDITAAVAAMDRRNGEAQQIHVRAGDDILLARTR